MSNILNFVDRTRTSVISRCLTYANGQGLGLGCGLASKCLETLVLSPCRPTSEDELGPLRHVIAYLMTTMIDVRLFRCDDLRPCL